MRNLVPLQDPNLQTHIMNCHNVYICMKLIVTKYRLAPLASGSWCVFFSADIWTCQSGRNTGGINYINDGSVPIPVQVSQSSEPDAQHQDLLYTECSHH